jgi:hypothetical protein
MTIATIAAIGSVGMVSDQLAHELPESALTIAENVRFRNGGVERMRGEQSAFGTPASTPYGLFVYQSGSNRFIVHAGATAVYVNDGSTTTDITGTAPTGSAVDRWAIGALGGVLVANNGKDAPMFWGGNTGLNLATLTAWPANTTCEVLKPWKNYLFALDVTKVGTRYQHMVKWSSAADPGTIPASWDETNPANDAGEVDLAETSDALVDALPLGDALIIYKESSTYAAQYIGGQYIFAFRRLPVDHGMLARGCAAEVPGGHVVLTGGDVVLLSAAGSQSIIDGKIRDWLFGQIDATYFDRSFVVAHPAYNEAWVCFPTSGNSACTKAIVWNWKENTVSTRDLNNATCAAAGRVPSIIDNTIDGDSGAIDSDSSAIDYVEGAQSVAQLVMATTAPSIRLVDSGTDFDGTNFDSLIERTGLSLGGPYLVKNVRSVYPRIDASAGSVLWVQIGATMDVELPYTWASPVQYTVGSTLKADTSSTGRFIGYRIWSETPIAWRMKSIDIDYVVTGNA